jgi:hypothetical protein
VNSAMPGQQQFMNGNRDSVVKKAVNCFNERFVDTYLENFYRYHQEMKQCDSLLEQTAKFDQFLLKIKDKNKSMQQTLLPSQLHGPLSQSPRITIEPSKAKPKKASLPRLNSYLSARISQSRQGEYDSPRLPLEHK